MSGILTRKSCWLVKEGCSCKYKYGKQNKHWDPSPFPPWMHEVSAFLEAELGLERGYFNSCNANFYESANHDLYFHADNEALFRRTDAPTSQRDVTIVSLSFGQSRLFSLKQNYAKGETIETTLSDGDILTMEGLLQENWQHAISKARAVDQVASSSSKGSSSNARFNLTFRRIQRHNKLCQANSAS